MYKRRRGLPQEEIQMLDLDKEPLSSSDSECEIDNDFSREIKLEVHEETDSEDKSMGTAPSLDIKKEIQLEESLANNVHEGTHLEEECIETSSYLYFPREVKWEGSVHEETDSNEESVDTISYLDIPIEIKWNPPTVMDEPKIHRFIGESKLKGEALTAVTEFQYFKALFSDDVFTKLVDETNKYASQFLSLDENVNNSSGKSHLRNWNSVTVMEFQKFIALTLLMGHIGKHTIKDYWSHEEMIETPFFGKVMSRDRYLHILRFLHFEDNCKHPNEEDQNYDHLWEIRSIFEKLNHNFKQVYEPSKEFAIDEVISSRSRINRYIPKKSRHYGIKLYKLTDKLGYTYNMTFHLHKDKMEYKFISTPYETVMNLADCIQGKGHHLYMDDFFTSPKLFLDLFEQFKINSCGTVRPNRKGFPKYLTQKKMKKGDVNIKFGAGMTAMCWKGKREVCFLSNIHGPNDSPYENGKPRIVECFDSNMGFAELSDRIANSYPVSRTMTLTKKIFFQLLDLSVLNSFILFKFKDNESSHQSFRLKLISQLIETSKVTTVQNLMPVSTKRLTKRSRYVTPSVGNHWPIKENVQRRCVACRTNNVRRRTSISCKACNVGLCLFCFESYHTSSN